MCQLKCPVCPLSTGKRGILGNGYLRAADFGRFAKGHPRIRNVELSNYGEIFLNPELEEIIALAHANKINLTALNGVNLNRASDGALEALVKYGFKLISVSIDGASNEVYRTYRRGGDLDAVIDNIKRINGYKRQYKRQFPRLLWQFVPFGHNAHELPAARKMAQELDMGFVVKPNWSKTYAPLEG